MTASNSLPRKGLAIIASGMVAFASFSMAPVAFAEDGDATTQQPGNTEGTGAEVNESLVNQLNKGDKAKLTIHKLKGNFSGTNPYGVVQDNVAGDPLDGITFDIYKVKGIDLSTVQGWKEYDKLAGSDPNKLITDGKAEKVASVKTANGGLAEFEGEIGVYVVKENLGASDVKPGTYSPAAPFITALPFTTEDGKAWNKNVHVYPKNQEQKANKEVKDQGKHAQDTIAYTLDGTVPPIPSNHKEGEKYFDGYSLVDIYDPEKWTPDTKSVKASIVNGSETIELAADDFQVSEPVDYAKEAGKKAFSISLTRTGLDKLEGEARKSDSVKVVATVEGKLAAGLAPGDVVNKGFLIPPNVAEPNWDRPKNPDDPNTPPETPTPETEVVSKYGKLEVTKVSSRDANAKLEGATFVLHKCENNNTAGGEGKLLDKKAEPLTVDGKKEWTTDAEGKFSITGIQLEDWFDGKSQDDLFDYCLVETKAPEGYELLPKPVLVPINQKTPEQTLASTISNVPSTPGTFKLPATGEWGRWWLIAGGAAALLAALGVAYNATRRNKDA